MDPETILAGLNDEQREAAMTTSGAVVIHAGAGTGKTRVISHRVAYGAATGAMDSKRTLVVTFPDKPAGEMQPRLRALGMHSATASTFHAAARRQLAYYWPMIHERPLPEVLDSKLRIIAPMARSLPGGYRFTPAKDLADEIEWAKVRRQTPETYQPEREPPVPELLPHSDGDSAVGALVARIRALLADGVAVTEIAVLVRTNAQLVPFEA